MGFFLFVFCGVCCKSQPPQMRTTRQITLTFTFHASLCGEKVRKSRCMYLCLIIQLCFHISTGILTISLVHTHIHMYNIFIVCNHFAGGFVCCDGNELVQGQHAKGVSINIRTLTFSQTHNTSGSNNNNNSQQINNINSSMRLRRERAILA